MSQEQGAEQNFGREPLLHPAQLEDITLDFNNIDFTTDPQTNFNSSLFFSPEEDQASSTRLLAMEIASIDTRMTVLCRSVDELSQSIRTWRNETWRAETAMYRLYIEIDGMLRGRNEQGADQVSAQDFDAAVGSAGGGGASADCVVCEDAETDGAVGQR